MDAETGQPIVPQDEGPPKPLREEELKSLSAFSDFVSTLDLDDLGQPRPESGEPESEEEEEEPE
jgi:hypothetical protein